MEGPRAQRSGDEDNRKGNRGERFVDRFTWRFLGAVQRYQRSIWRRKGIVRCTPREFLGI